VGTKILNNHFLLLNWFKSSCPYIPCPFSKSPISICSKMICPCTISYVKALRQVLPKKLPDGFFVGLSLQAWMVQRALRFDKVASHLFGDLFENPIQVHGSKLLVRLKVWRSGTQRLRRTDLELSKKPYAMEWT